MTLHHELKRASVRDDVAAMLARMAERVGATFERTTNPLNPRGYTVYVRLDGAACMIHLDGDSKVGAFLGHWHFSDRRGRLFRAGFDGHGYRPHHKATSMTENAEDLCVMLEARFGWIADGSAFIDEAAGALVGKSLRFDYPNFGTPNGFPDYTAHSGQVVHVVRALTDAECDRECQPMVEVRAADGWSGSVNASELAEVAQ